MKFQLTTAFLICSFISCVHSNKHIYEIENAFGIKLTNQVSNEIVDERWNDFNGDGYRVVVYDILDDSKIGMMIKEMTKYDSAFIEESFRKSEMYSYLKESSGYYLKKEQNDDEYYLFYNVSNNRIIYFHSIM